MAQEDNLTRLYNAIKSDYNTGTEADFRRHMLLPGKAGYENRRQLFTMLRQDNWDVGDTYEDFRDRIGLVPKQVGQKPNQTNQADQPLNGVPTTTQSVGEGRLRGVSSARPSSPNQPAPSAPLPDYANGNLLKQADAQARGKDHLFWESQKAKVKKIVDDEHVRRNQPVQKNAPGASMTVGQVEDDAFLNELQGVADKSMTDRNRESAASSRPIMSPGQLLTESNLQGIQTEQNAANTEQDVIRYANGIDAGRKQRIMDMYGLETEQEWNNFVRQAAKGSVNRKMMADTKKVSGFMTSMMENSIVGKTAMTAAMPTRQRQMLTQANQEWADGAHWYQTLPAQVGGLMLDAPLFQGFGALANLGVKGAAGGVRAAGGLKIFNRLNKAAGAAAPRLWSTIAGTAQKRLMQQQAGGLLYGMVRSGLTFGLYDATNDMVSQRYMGDTNALQAGEYGKNAGINWGETGRSFLWGTLTGAATGAVGHGINRATRYLNGGKKALADAGGFMAEAGTFAGVGLLRDAAEGKDVTLDTAKDELVGSITFLLGMKAPHAAMGTGGALINNVGDMVRGKTTFANAMKGTFNDVFKAAESRLNDTSLSLSPEEIRSLHRGGYVSADAKDTKAALRDLFTVESPAGLVSKEQGAERTPSLEEVNMTVALKYRGILADPDIPATLKTKLSRLVENTPRTYMNSATSASIETREDGTATVRVTCPDKDGQPVLYMEKDFKNEAEAKRWYQSVEGELEVNRMNSNAVAFMNSWAADVKSSFVDAMDEADREVYQSAALKRARNEKLDPLEQQAMDAVDARVKSIIEGNGGMDGVVEAYERQHGLSRGTILEIQKKRQNLSEQEQAIAADFANYLNDMANRNINGFENKAQRLLDVMKDDAELNSIIEKARGGENPFERTIPDNPKVSIKGILHIAKNVKNKVYRAVIAGITPRQKSDFAAKGINVDDGYVHSIENSAVIHNQREHGDPVRESRRGQIAITDADYEVIPEILDKYDNVEKSPNKDKQGNDVLVYTKTFPDGTIYYLEEVRENRKSLAFRTMYKRKKGNGSSDESVQSDAHPFTSVTPPDNPVSIGKGTNFSSNEQEIPSDQPDNPLPTIESIAASRAALAPATASTLDRLMASTE